MVVKTYMDMDQDSEEEKQQYLALALHLASEFFLRNPNKDVRLLVACCLADIFRIYAPEAPYTSHDKLKVRTRTGTAGREFSLKLPGSSLRGKEEATPPPPPPTASGKGS